jgi:hypothetical protein
MGVGTVKNLAYLLEFPLQAVVHDQKYVKHSLSEAKQSISAVGDMMSKINYRAHLLLLFRKTPEDTL